ncbi:MAG TPA: (2Fe-2S)-binding protein [Usitatibacter sp.]|nr:(2Fe-2S)-binding protein [Usitatibacter sp.]
MTEPFPMIDVELRVNGRPVPLTLEPRELLVDVLRDRLDLPGTKRSCDIGVCGACTVLIDGMPATSCSMLACDADGREITTIEGVGGAGNLDPVQQAFLEHGALQCGFCTPGMVLAVKSLLAQNPHPTEEEVRHYLRGNLCRCTGYVKIIEAVLDLAKRGDRP